MQSLFIILAFASSIFNSSFAKDPEIEVFKTIELGKDLGELKADKKELEEWGRSGEQVLWKKRWNHGEATAVAFFQVREKKIQSFLIRFPTALMHDSVLEILTKKLGPHDSFFREKEHAVFQWKNEKEKHTYQAACTITCFPLSYSAEQRLLPNGRSLFSLSNQKAFDRL